MNEPTDETVVIVGSGVAGQSAASYGVRADLEARADGLTHEVVA